MDNHIAETYSANDQKTPNILTATGLSGSVSTLRANRQGARQRDFRDSKELHVLAGHRGTTGAGVKYVDAIWPNVFSNFDDSPRDENGHLQLMNLQDDGDLVSRRPTVRYGGREDPVCFGVPR